MRELTKNEIHFLKTQILPNYIIYSKAKKTGYCLACKSEFSSDLIENKRSASKLICPVCRKESTLKYYKKTGDNKLSDECTGVIPCKEDDDFVLRYYVVARYFGDDNTEERIYFAERMREFYRKTGKMILYDRVEGDNYFTKCNNFVEGYCYSIYTHRPLGVHVRLPFDNAKIYLRNINIYKKGTNFERVDIKYLLNEKLNHVHAAYAFFNECNQGWSNLYECLMKCGFNKLARQIAQNVVCGSHYAITGSLIDMLKLTPAQYRELLNHANTATTSEVANYQNRNRIKSKYNLKTEDEIDLFIKHIEKKEHNAEKFFEHFKYSLHKFDKYVSSYQGKFDLGTYVDYLSMCDELGMDMRNTFIVFPKDVDKAHEVTVTIYNEMKFDAKLMKYADEANNFTEQFKHTIEPNTNKYSYEIGDIKIVIPQSTLEIGTEGYKLRHCVAQYMEDICKDKKIILFARKKSELNVPYYTIEIIGNEITQCKGYNNRPREKEVQDFIESFAKEKHLTITKKEHFNVVM